MDSLIESIVEHNEDFYPTPRELIERMLSNINLTSIQNVLEPSAGKGDIIECLLEKDYNIWVHEGFFEHLKCIDCIEIDPELRSILKYNYGAGRIEAANKILFSLPKYEEDRTAEQKRIHDEMLKQRHFADSDIVHIVYDDFLSYVPYKEYDLIIMNPPFSNGCAHLLKALEIQKNGGSIACILNAETIKNPFSDQRQKLVKLLTEYNAKIEYVQDAFRFAERRTDVEVALIYVYIPPVERKSDIYEHMREAEHLDDADFISETTDLDVTDYIKSAVSHFNVEVKAGIELIRQYRAFKRYMRTSFDERDNSTILRLTDSYDRGYDDVSINNYLEKTRLKYWSALLTNQKFIGKLTSKLQDEYRKKIDRLKAYDFNEFNINELSVQIMSEVKTGIEDEIGAMFDRLSESHSWHGEDSPNRHYYDGWVTNKAWKIGKKVILPCYGVFSEWSGRPEVYKAVDVLSDIERIFNFFDGKMTADVDLASTLEVNFKNGITRNIPCKFFYATFYKKGTVHIVFTNQELLERFNIYAARNRNWLPPSYGKKQYKDMTESEQKVVDSFQGEQEYEKVMQRPTYYLSGNMEQMMLESAV